MTNEIFTQNYRISHSIEEPSEMSDYDYDPSRPLRRFISTYIHKVEFFDVVTDQRIISLSFSSETCAQFIVGLYGVYFKRDNTFNDAYPISPDPTMSTVLDEAISLRKFVNYGNILLTTVTPVFIDNSTRAGSVVISRNQDYVQLSIINQGSPVINLRISLDEAGYLLNLLETEEMEDMFVSYDDGYGNKKNKYIGELYYDY